MFNADDNCCLLFFIELRTLHHTCVDVLSSVPRRGTVFRNPPHCAVSECCKNFAPVPCSCIATEIFTLTSIKFWRALIRKGLRFSFLLYCDLRLDVKLIYSQCSPLLHYRK